MAIVLLISVFVIATCGLVYELISGALASYLLGDSVTQFSTVIGVYLFSMGIGSFLSKYVNRNLTSVFIQVELLIGLVGGCSAAILFVAFEYITAFRVLLYSLVGITGTLVGLEIPLLMRILKDHFEFKDLVSKVFTFDYVGALIASLLFPTVLVPHLGLIRSAFFFGILNVLVAIWTLYLFGREIAWARLLRVSAVCSLVLLVFGFAYSDKIMSFAETASYQDTVIYAKSSKYQRIVLTKSPNDVRLFLNGNLQFSSRDEYRYHEALVHPAMLGPRRPQRVLVMGGGDGLAVREILKYPEIREVLLVDLDPAMTQLSKTFPPLVGLNKSSLLDPRVRVVNQDAFVWINEAIDPFDAVIIDFPDPGSFSIGKLYTSHFFRKLKTKLHPDSLVSIQCTSPLVAPKSYWCVIRTLEAAGYRVRPFHATVPSFGIWGYALASLSEPDVDAFQLALDQGSFRFLNNSNLHELFVFPQDIPSLTPEINRLDNQALVRYYDEEWHGYD